MPLSSSLNVLSAINIGLNAQLRLMEQNGSASILAQPVLSARNGAEASFLAGGEFPYSVSNINGTTIQFKPYGIRLEITPTVDRQRRDPGADHERGQRSRPLGHRAVAGPALRTRKTETEFNVLQGGTIVLSGLLSRDINASIDKVPFLGDIPVLGALFRSRRFQNNETELVVFVTPHAVNKRTVEQAETMLRARQRLDGTPRATEPDLSAVPGLPAASQGAGRGDYGQRARPALPLGRTTDAGCTSMFQVTITAPEAPPRIESITDTSAIIGKGRECQLRLPGWKVGREHARIFRTKAGLHIQDLGQLFGTSVNGNRIQQYGPITRGDRIGVGPYTLVIEDRLETPSLPIAAQTSDTGDSPAVDTPSPRSVNDGKVPTPQQFWRQRIHEALLDAIDLRRRDLVRMADEELRAETEALLVEVIDKESALPDSIDRDSLLRDVLDEAVGLGPLETLLDDDTITEIMVNRHDEIYLERNGRLERHPGCFTSDRAVLGVIERIVAPIGRRIDEASPMVDARLKDGSRVNAIIPPLAIKGPALTIRKFGRKVFSHTDLVQLGALSPADGGVHAHLRARIERTS